MNTRAIFLALTAASLSAACGDSAANAPADGGAAPPRDAAPAGPSEPIPVVGSAGMDAIGRCQLQSAQSPLMGATACVDYDDGYDDASARAHCTAAMGTFYAGESCRTNHTAYVASCTVTQESVTRRMRFSLANRSTALPASAVEAWCTAQSGTYDGPMVPRNTGSCAVIPASVVADRPNQRTCTEYTLNYLAAAAMSDCGRGEYTAGDLCEAANRIGGCRYENSSGRVKVTYVYAENQSSPDGAPSEEEVRTWCTSTMGTYVAPEMAAE